MFVFGLIGMSDAVLPRYTHTVMKTDFCKKNEWEQVTVDVSFSR